MTLHSRDERMSRPSDIDGRQLTTASTSLRAQLGQTTTALADHARTPVLGDLLRAADVRAAWEASTLERQRAVIAGTVREGRLTPESVVASPGTPQPHT